MKAKYDPTTNKFINANELAEKEITFKIPKELLPKGEQGIKGDKGDLGAQGIKGDRGDPGKDGRDGINGYNGKDGRDGKDGKSVTSKDGIGIANIVQKNNDTFTIILSNGSEKEFTLPKAKNSKVSGGGSVGIQFLGGLGAPGAGVGSYGDYYIDKINKILYGPKGGAWGVGVSLGTTSFNNIGSIALKTYTLTNITPGWRGRYIVENIHGIEVVAPTNVTIYDGGDISSVGGNISSYSVGSVIELEMISTSEIFVVNSMGNWDVA